MIALKILTVSDIHRLKRLYQELPRVVAKHRPDVVAVVGDFLHAVGDSPLRLKTAEWARILARLDCQKVVFVRGNHEGAAWSEFAGVWNQTGRPLSTLHGEALVYGPLVAVGFPCSMGDPRAYVGGRKLSKNPKQWLNLIRRQHGHSVRTLWLMHEPAAATPLTLHAGPVSGNPNWNGLIHHFRPLMTVSGHDHRSPIRNNCWYAQIGSSVCVNVGQSDSGPVHYSLIEAWFPGIAMLPVFLSVTGFPWNETLTITLGE